jgi:uncharacterized membrane protein YeiB
VGLATAIFFVFLVAVFLFSVGFQLLGHHIGARWRAQGQGGYNESTSAIQSSLFALLGLLIAFTISGGQDRLDARRHLIVEEANTIETAYLRLDLLPPAAQPALREMFRRYTENRIAYFQQMSHLEYSRLLHDRAGQLQRQIWTAATEATRDSPDLPAALLTLPAINAMIDVTTSRDAALRTHVPISMFALLLLLAFSCALLAGMEMSKQPRPSAFHVLAFAGTLALTCYVMVNIELPRIGFAPLAPIDALLAQVRQHMG